MRPLPSSELLQDWLQRQLPEFRSLVPLSGDISSRRYYRVFSPGITHILVQYPKPKDTTLARYLQTTAILEEADLPVPSVEQFDLDLGLALLSDAGEQTLYEARDRFSPVQLRQFIKEAAALLPTIQDLDKPAVRDLSPALDGPALDAELEVTWNHFFSPLSLNTREENLRGLLTELCYTVARSQIPCHRDFMARNLIPDPKDPEALTIIDHQDLRLGPRAYDLASLLNDSLFADYRLEQSLLKRYCQGSSERADYSRCVVQRCLKGVGTFCRFAATGQPRYLPLVPKALERSLTHLKLLPEARDLVSRLEGEWLPIIDQTLDIDEALRAASNSMVDQSTSPS